MIEVPQRPAAADGGPPAGGTRPEAGGRSPASAGRSRTDERLRYSLWLIVCCLLLAVLAFATRPGNILADTKIDLAVNPLGFLHRALQLWDPSQFGQLQNQAVGYLFPMGPFFALGKLMALPGWVVQRLWLTALSVAAFLGTVRLARRLEIGTQGTRIAAGLAYALSPRALTLLGVNSGELLPAAMLPLILIPLVRLMRHGHEMDRRGRLRAVAQSAAAVALCSGMNAASVVAVLSLALIYILTGERSWSRWRVLACWAPAVVLATCWWSVPLLLLGKYGVSILPYSESAQITTSVTSLSDMMRGTEDWDAYLVVNGSAWWPVGYILSTATLPTIATGAVAGFGLSGFLSRRLPERRFLLCALLAGLVIVGSGYVSGLGNPLAASVDHLINGPLAPLRNIRKFDPLIRLPIALGLAHLLASVRWPRSQVVVRLLAAAGLAIVALPAYTGGVSQAGDFSGVPAYWVSAANWLTRHAGNQAVLELPGARFGEYLWGRPLDDVLQPLFAGDWASDQLSAIGSAGNTRLLDAIERQVDAGAGSAGLAQLLARMGIRYVLVRNDLIRSDLYGAWPARIADALNSSPGLHEVAHFGTGKVGNAKPDDAVSNFDAPYPPIEILQVAGAQPVASVVPAASTLRVYGGPESLLTLADLGALKGRPVVLNSDSPGIAASQDVITDSLRRIQRNFGEIRLDYTQTLTARAPLSDLEAANDYLEPSWLPYQSVAQYHGIANVTASSSTADITALPGQSATGGLPFAAVDGNPATSWESGGLTGPVHQWLQVDFDHPADPGAIQVGFDDNVFIGPPVTRVTVTTSAGTVTDSVRQTSRPQALAVPSGATRWLRITVAAVGPYPFGLTGSQVGISGVSVPGVMASRTIMAPTVSVPGRVQPSVLLAKAEPQPTGCMRTSLRWVCSPSLVRPTEEQYGFDEGFTSPAGHAATLTGQAIMTSTRLIARYAWPGQDQPRVTASSAYTADPEDMAAAAFDGTMSTAWISGAGNQHPVLRIRWHGMKTIRDLEVIQPPGGNSLAQVSVTDPAGQLTGGFIGRGNKLTFGKPLRTDELTLAFSPANLPLQIAEVVVPGVRPLRARAAAAVRLRCGLGPTISLDGRLVPTSATGTAADLLYGRPMTFTACSTAEVRAGQDIVDEPAADPTGWDVQSVLVSPPGAESLQAAATVRSAPARVISWNDSRRILKVTAAQQSYLELAQNFNAGWQASINGKTLTPVQLDGWEQAWLLPAGTQGIVTLTYQPDGTYRDALIGGLALLAIIVGIALLPRRRRTASAAATAAADRGAGDRGAGDRELAGRELTGREPGDQGAGDRELADPGPAAQELADRGPADGAQHRQRRTGWPLRGVAACACVGLLALLGLWLAGLTGAVLLPATTFLFIAAGRLAGSSTLAGAICAAVSSRWLPVVLLVAAAAAGAAGILLQDRAASGALITVLTDVGPQLLCLVIVSRIVAELFTTSD
jgi:arabinofuranan 3-O-arabinosyltransferase